DVFLFSASEFAVELLLWFTSPLSPLLRTRTGAFTFDWTPGAEVASEPAFWSISFFAFSDCRLDWLCVGSDDPPLQHGAPSCSADWAWFEPWPWSIVWVELFVFSASELAVEELLWVTSPEPPPPQQLVPPVETGAFTL